MRKLHQIILQEIKNCKICSAKEIRTIENLDGICQNCSLLVIALNRYAVANIPIEYWFLDIKDFVGPEQLKKIYANSVNNIESIYTQGLSFCLAGPHGIGKTTIATLLLKKTCQKNYNCLYTTLSDIVSSIIHNTGYGYFDKFLIRKELLDIDFLVIDEFDNRFFNTENAADLFGKTFEGIIRTRLSNKLPTFFCTNSPNPIDGFNGSLKESIESLMSKVKIFPVFGNDFRKIQVSKEQ